MAVTTITPQDIVMTGLTPVYAAANADGSKIPCSSDERLFLQLKNTNGSTRTVTIDLPDTAGHIPGYGAVTLADAAIVIPITTGDKMIGPIPPRYVDSAGFVNITFNAVTDLTIAAFKLARAA